MNGQHTSSTIYKTRRADQTRSGSQTRLAEHNQPSNTNTQHLVYSIYYYYPTTTTLLLLLLLQ